MERLARANQSARDTSLRTMSIDQSTRVLEGLISHPITQPHSTSVSHPVSLSHLRRAEGGAMQGKHLRRHRSR